jgi:hypothetical protein
MCDGEIVGNCPTLGVGERSTNLKMGESLTSWTSFWGGARIPPGCIDDFRYGSTSGNNSPTLVVGRVQPT